MQFSSAKVSFKDKKCFYKRLFKIGVIQSSINETSCKKNVVVMLCSLFCSYFLRELLLPRHHRQILFIMFNGSRVEGFGASENGKILCYYIILRGFQCIDSSSLVHIDIFLFKQILLSCLFSSVFCLVFFSFLSRVFHDSTTTYQYLLY